MSQTNHEVRMMSASGILGYGLKETDLDDSDPQLKEAVKAFREAALLPLAKLDDRLRKYEA